MRGILIASAATLILTACKSESYPKGEWVTESCEAASDLQGTEPGDRASALLRQTLESDRGAGISAAVMIDGKLVWSDAAGRSGHRGEALTTAARMRIGSVSKPLTAALVAHLAEEKVLDLDAPIQTWVPEFPDKGHDITLRHLGRHTSGIRHYDFGNFSEANSTVHYAAMSDMLPIFADDPLLFAPGEDFHYSSFGINLAGAAVERATGEHFGDVFRDKIAGPMGLNGTVIDNPATATPCRARFHTVFFGKLRTKTLWRDHSDAYPSGGMLSTSEDLVRFTDLVFNSDHYSSDTIALFQAPTVLPDEKVLRWTFGWEVERRDDGSLEWIGHGGTTNGAYASVRHYPSTKMTVAGITNYNFFLTEKIARFHGFIEDEVPAIFSETEK